MKQLFVRIFFLLSIAPLWSQTSKINKYWIEFSDKENSPYCTCRPTEFLSARALERRAKANIPVVENDLPVNEWYLDSLRSRGVIVHGASKWLNACSIVSDSLSAARLSVFPFVKKIEYIGRHIKPRNAPNPPIKKREPWTKPLEIPSEELEGYAIRQNNVMGVVPLTRMGLRGEGIWIAVMDGGFINADDMPFFDSAALQNRLFSAWDFVERDGFVYEAANHGTSVLSVMASNMPKYFVGTAPDATYFLLKTEDTGGEFPIEEANWIAGAEFSDSLGVDLINASLGYTSFSDTTLNHRFKTLDGRTAIGSRGATIAAQKGMIICNSAGNSGDEPWHYIGVPADAAGVIAVGATDYEGKKAGFSSFGPSADGRIKPDLAAPGDMVITAGSKQVELGYSSGTSIASPMLVGAIASLWSAFPEKTGEEIKEAVFRFSDQFEQPNNEKGYGVPQFFYSWAWLSGYMNDIAMQRTSEGLFAFEPVEGKLSLLNLMTPIGALEKVFLRNSLGEYSAVEAVLVEDGFSSRIEVKGLEMKEKGAYSVVAIGKNDLVWRFRVVI
jgi:serine protease AprX